MNYVTIDNSAEVTDVNLTDGYKYYYTVRAVGISRDEEYYISSDFTAPHFVEYNTAGLSGVSVSADASVEVSGRAIVINNPGNKSVRVFDIAGSLVHESLTGSEREDITLGNGFYIVRVGDSSFKVNL